MEVVVELYRFCTVTFSLQQMLAQAIQATQQCPSLPLGGVASATTVVAQLELRCSCSELMTAHHSLSDMPTPKQVLQHGMLQRACKLAKFGCGECW
jgi:hypothetical protein